MERNDRLEQDQEDAAAQEAGAIGGEPGVEPGYDGDPDRPGVDRDEATRAVSEAGGGSAEGFEQAEAMLQERATNPRGPSPQAHAGVNDEEEAAIENARETYAEPDRIVPSEIHEEDRGD